MMSEHAFGPSLRCFGYFRFAGLELLAVVPIFFHLSKCAPFVSLIIFLTSFVYRNVNAAKEALGPHPMPGTQ